MCVLIEGYGSRNTGDVRSLGNLLLVVEEYLLFSRFGDQIAQTQTLEMPEIELCLRYLRVEGVPK